MGLVQLGAMLDSALTRGGFAVDKRHILVVQIGELIKKEKLQVVDRSPQVGMKMEEQVYREKQYITNLTRHQANADVSVGYV